MLCLAVSMQLAVYRSIAISGTVWLAARMQLMLLQRTGHLTREEQRSSLLTYRGERHICSCEHVGRKKGKTLSLCFTRHRSLAHSTKHTPRSSSGEWLPPLAQARAHAPLLYGSTTSSL
jgi:hypothetical protein